MNKEDKIKELAKDISIAFQLAGTTKFGAVAEILVDKWQRKIPENSVIVSKQVWEEHIENWDKTTRAVEERVRKETADKFIKECKKYKVKKFTPVGIDQRDIGVSWIEMPEWKLDEFAKSLGVKIKE